MNRTIELNLTPGSVCYITYTVYYQHNISWR